MLLVVCFFMLTVPNSLALTVMTCNCLTSVISWMESYQLSLATAKCQHLPITHHPNADNVNNQYYIGNQKISSLSAVCDLGIVISSNLKWCQHVCSIVSKAFICSHQILHCFNSNNV